jgi:uncharacterized protein (TIRG00374 family)
MSKLINTGLKLLISVTLLGYLIYEVDVTRLGDVFAQTVLWPFATAVCFFVLSNLLGSFQWFLLLRAQLIQISFWQAMVFYFVGVFFNNLLLGNIGGDALRIYDIRRLTGNATGGVAATLIDRFVGLFSTCSLALVAILMAADIPTTGLLSILVPVWMALVVILVMGLSRRIGSRLESISSAVLPERLGSLLGELRNSIIVYRHRAPLLAAVLGVSLGVQFCRILVYWSAGLAVGLNVGLLYFVCFQPIAAIVAALPISIGGLGVRENSLVRLFGSVGVSPEVATATSLLGYVAGIIASLLGGAAFVLRRVERREAVGQHREQGA